MELLATARNQNGNNIQQTLIISREVFAALSPLDQVAAKALEKCGLVEIVEKIEETSSR